MFSAVKQHIPQITLKRHSRPPWICNDIMKLIRKKRKLWNQVKSNGSVDIFLKFKELKKKTKRLNNTSYYKINIFNLSLGNFRTTLNISGHFTQLNLKLREFQRLLFMILFVLQIRLPWCNFLISSSTQFIQKIQLMSMAWLQMLWIQICYWMLQLQHLKCRKF